MPRRKCFKATCRTLIDYTDRYCKEHKGYGDKQYNKEIRYNRDNKMYSDFYNSTAWRKLSSTHKQEHPLCEQCLKEGIVTQVNVTDHIKEIRDSWEDRLDWDNLQSLCHEHHNRKTKEVARGR